MSGRLVCLAVCTTICLVSFVTSENDLEKQEQDSKCWIMGEAFRLCLNHNDPDPNDYITPLEASKRPSSTIFTRLAHEDLSLPSYYSPRKLSENDRMSLPFLLKKRFQSKLPYKMADEVQSSVFLKKRPFDSISYSTGFGEFK